MKAREVLRRYADGERDFRRVNLRGQSFKGKNLSGANFTEADIRSADFSNANLSGANFREAKAGLQRRWAIFLFIVSLSLLLLSGFCSLFVGALVALIFDGSSLFEENPIRGTILGWVSLIMVIIFCVVTMRQGIATAFGSVAVAGAVVVVVAGAFAGAGTVTVALIVAIVGAFAGAGTFAGAVAVAGAGTVAFAVAGAFAVVRAFAVAGAGTVTGAFAGVFILFSAYIAWQAIKGDEKQALIRNIAVAFAANGGTSFRGANLTDADFTGAILKNTDLRKSIPIRTSWRNTKKLDLIRSGNTYLQNTQVRQLLLTGQGQDKKFDNLPLRGINLQGAKLADASFIAADLSEANLQGADLSRAKLKQTQLDATDFTGATLTGSYIEDWGITSQTNFTGVRCEYVYMRLPTKDNPEPLRKPDNNAEVFADGEFGDFIKPIVDTLDLYHNQGIDPRAIAISFKELAENNPDAELEIVAMEKRGSDKFLLQAKTSSEANKSELSAEYFETYNQLQTLAEQEIQALMAEKDNRIRSLENMVHTALQRPNYYTQGNTNNMAGDRKIETGGGNYNESGTYKENVAGDSNRSINYHGTEQKQTLAEAAEEIQQLLEQLENSYPADTTTGKMSLATEAINHIENNPTLAARILSALKMGSIKGFEQFLNHPAASFVIAALEDWQKTKENQS